MPRAVVNRMLIALGAGALVIVLVSAVASLI
jgi:hypothetical protein